MPIGSQVNATCRRWAMVAAVLLTAWSPAAAGAQDGGHAANSTDVVVVARDRAKTERQIHDFVSALTPTVGDAQVARFDVARLCPFVVGLTPEDSARIAARMRRVARAAGIEVAADDCPKFNALVIFTDDKDATVKLLRRRYSDLMGNEFGELIAIHKEPGPAVAWHLTRRLGPDSIALQADGDGTLSTRTTDPASRIMPTVHPTFVMSVVVIERRGADGLTAMQLADYATMRTLADVEPAKAAGIGVPTILSVLDTPMGRETPLSLTQWDFDFLRGLRAAPSHLFAGAQRGAIDRSMRKAIEAPASAVK